MADQGDAAAGGLPPAQTHELALVESVGHRTWLARDGGDALVMARYLADSSGPEADAALIERAGLAADLRHPALLPVLGTGRHNGAVWLASAVDGGVPLRRLLRLAGLTPVQVAVVLADVLAGLQVLHDAGYAHGALHADNVHVGPDGTARLSDWAPAVIDPRFLSRRWGRSAGEEKMAIGAPAPYDELRRRDRAAVATLAADLVGAARRTDDALRTLVQSVANGELGETLSEPVAALGEATEQEARQRARHELSALVAAVPRHGRLRQVAARPPGHQVEPQPSTVARERKAPGPARRLLSWLWVGVATVVVLAALVTAQLVLFGDTIREDLEVLLAPPDDAATVDTTPVRSPDPVPMLGPEAADPVTAVDLRVLRRCRPGADCPVRVLVDLRPQTEQTAVTWRFDVVDRCTGRRLEEPGAGGNLPAGGDRLDTLDSVPLPEGRSLAVVPVTTAPAVAAGAPVLIAADGGGCPER